MAFFENFLYPGCRKVYLPEISGIMTYISAQDNFLFE
jgi:hypothetical protein